MWREDVLAEAWRRVRRNGGAAGVDGETFADIESYGVGRWLGELARELKEGSYAPKAVRQVLIAKRQPGKFRPLGIPCLRDRVAQTSALLMLEPIFEADLQPEQYAYRPERSAHDAVKRVHSLLHTGHNEVVECDLSNYSGGIPHGELLKSFARRISDGRISGSSRRGWRCRWRRTTERAASAARTERARGAKASRGGADPLASNLYMRREDVDGAMRAILSQLARRAEQSTGDAFVQGIWRTALEECGPHGALQEVLSRWAGADSVPLVLMIDEIDALMGDTLLTVLRQLRGGYPDRPRWFPQSVILCGVRDVRDYRIRSASENAIVAGGSAFNVKAKSLRLGDFSPSEVRALLAQHT